ncbi:glutaminyl-peptide cyclotransferase [Segetibacter koreensis]|uniref:glutaminyl-peptide cyclotransferase n=1 Tax=Segetibacter koreensis TaxID=398037 RepID=UPI00036059AB|nr:glutaminyl-peptide cyclotransferase [Segetibacter koreensis]
MKKFLAFSLLALSVAACNTKSSNDNDTTTNATPNTVAPPANISYNIVATYPHDTSSFTQGLIWQNNTLYEGTGLEGHSRLMTVNLKNGKASQSVALDPSIFGEGITILNNKIYQLTWQNHKVYVYDAKTLKKLKELTWEHDGWGLTNNGTDLIASTGESNLYIVDPETFKIKRIIGVSDNTGPVGNLNELEYVNGAIYANIYLTDYIIKIDPANGHILGKIDLSGLLTKAGKNVDTDEGYVLNGIAYDSAKKSMYITGKKWPLIFEMKVN